MAIVIENLTHIYSPNTPFSRVALNGVSLTIQNGEFVGLAGHTGSGKSTLVQHLNGLLLPSAGRLQVEGVEIKKGADLRALRRRVGLVFQYPEYQLFEETVYKDIAFGPKNLGVPEGDMAATVKAAMALVGLPEELAQQSPFLLSGGQRRRVALAGVLAMRPQVLILDEPIAGLDPQGRAELLAYVREYRAQTNATVVMISHRMDDLAEQAERIIVLNKGEVALDGTPREVFSHGEQLTAMGLDLPQAARLTQLLRNKGIPAPLFITPADVLSFAAARGKK